jgi:hypothetical protein
MEGEVNDGQELLTYMRYVDRIRRNNTHKATGNTVLDFQGTHFIIFLKVFALEVLKANSYIGHFLCGEIHNKLLFVM